MTPPLKLAELRVARRKARLQRLGRRLKQFNLLSLFVLLTLVGGICVIGPPAGDWVRSRAAQLTLPYRLRQEEFARLKANRPAATAYRNERFIAGEGRYLLTGECLINGKWHRYQTGGYLPYTRRLPE